MTFREGIYTNRPVAFSRIRNVGRDLAIISDYGGYITEFDLAEMVAGGGRKGAGTYFFIRLGETSIACYRKIKSVKADRRGRRTVTIFSVTPPTIGSYRMAQHHIKHWNDIKSDFRETLILGNGASIAVSEKFQYDSLYQKARDLNLINENTEKIFESLGCNSDFEAALHFLSIADHVNDALGIDDSGKILANYESIRKGLVEAVKTTHPHSSSVAHHFDSMGRFMGHFKNVFSLNYDLLVYWAAMHENTKSPNRFKDCFIDGEFTDDWERFTEPYGGTAQATLVFYPHGNLVLTTDVFGNTSKLKSQSDTDLLSTISQSWNLKDKSPLFVSEGNSSLKVKGIRRNPYLHLINSTILRLKRSSITIYGWSLDPRDDHILHALAQSGVDRIAISVFIPPDEANFDSQAFCNLAMNRLLQAKVPGNVEFFDSSSDGCWVYPKRKSFEEVIF